MRWPLVAFVVLASSCGSESPMRRPADDMVKIPGGTFTAGCDPKQNFDCRYQAPLRTERVVTFEIDRREVTVDEYRRCYQAGPCRAAADRVLAHAEESATRSLVRPLREPEPFWMVTKPLAPDLPMWDVSAVEARAYCAWVGKRLPTELEWERAARGDDARPYPWGADPPDCERAASLDCPRVKSSLRPMEHIVHPVGTLPRGASPYGVLDMVGNVAEWADRSDGDESRAVALGGHIQIPPSANPSSLVLGQRIAEPDARSRISGDVGIRCARSAGVP